MEYTTTLREHTPIVVTIGNFDGIHKGHQFLMQELRTMAHRLNCVPAMITFSPHTLLVVRPDIDVQYLTTLEEKLQLTKAYGDIVDSIIIHFTPEVAAMPAEEFMDTLRAHFEIKGMVVGANFSLGHNRKGDVTFLNAYGQAHGIQVQSVSLQEAERARISSTRIRNLVNEGNVNEANEMLGHPVIFSGIVQHGDERGRLIGFPTANLRPEPHRLLPANGVYAIRVHVPEGAGSDEQPGSRVYNGAANIGVRPTFGQQERLVEAHLLDTSIDLYGKLITVEFIARLRGEQRFSGIDALKAQIATDAQQAREILRPYSETQHH
ncbi:MAG TPA: bifunctional riboflavin kinase/FAD synthetase [Ktedonobacteraceae bacterium]|jgi:riboflavin kinase/FMN adenylyltransferase|nr:bifunctional riboflavin kinase/FAD synthetase [Ktedonobacteraceae bacterium]